MANDELWAYDIPIRSYFCLALLKAEELLTEAMAAAKATQEVVSRLPETTGEEFDAAVRAAADAFPAWKRTPVSVRARVMFKLQQLIREQTVSIRQAQLWFTLIFSSAAREAYATGSLC